MSHELLLQLALAFVEYHLKRAEPLHHLGHGGAFISRLHAGHDKGVHFLDATAMFILSCSCRVLALSLEHSMLGTLACLQFEQKHSHDNAVNMCQPSCHLHVQIHTAIILVVLYLVTCCGCC